MAANNVGKFRYSFKCNNKKCGISWPIFADKLPEKQQRKCPECGSESEIIRKIKNG